jgi:hypothetical protein
MFTRTHFRVASWTIVRADDKKHVRINVIKDLLFRLVYKNKDENLLAPDPKIIFNYDERYLQNGFIAL